MLYQLFTRLFKFITSLNDKFTLKLMSARHPAVSAPFLLLLLQAEEGQMLLLRKLKSNKKKKKLFSKKGFKQKQMSSVQNRLLHSCLLFKRLKILKQFVLTEFYCENIK